MRVYLYNQSVYTIAPQERIMVAQKPIATFLQNIHQLDIGPLAYLLMVLPSGPQWTEDKTVKAIARYLAFLYLVNLYPRMQLVPTQEIDLVWHYHILDTEKYAIDCHLLFGQFIHHFPYFGQRSSRDREQLLKAFTLTQVLFKKHFKATLFPLDQLHSADCEPLILSSHSKGAGCSRVLPPYLQRPTARISCEDVLAIVFQETR